MRVMNFTVIIKVTQLIIFIFLINSVIISGQETGVMPTQLPGLNSVIWDNYSNSYKFYHNGILRYEYTLLNGITSTGGTFNVIKAYDENNSFFYQVMVVG